MKSLTDYKKFFSSIEDPLERLDGIEVLLEDLENPLTQIQGHYDMGSISSEEYETESQKIDSYFKWGLYGTCLYQRLLIKDPLNQD